MSVSIATLSVLLTASANKFDSVMDSSEKRTGKLAGSFGVMGKVAGGVAGAGLAVIAAGAAAAGAAFGILAAGVRSSIGDITELSDAADRLGIDTADAGALKFFGEMNATTFEDIEKGMEKLLVKVGEAQGGMKSASATFSQLGIDVDSLSGKSADDVFLTSIDAIGKLSTHAQKASAAYKLFGKSGLQLLPAIEAGRDGFEAAREEAEKLGILFERDLAEKVNVMDDQMNKLGLAWTGVTQTLAIEVAPIITALVDKLLATATAGEGIGPKVVGAFEWVLKAIAKASDYLALFVSGWKWAQASITGIVLSITMIINKLSQGVVWVIKQIDKLPGVNIDIDYSESLQLFEDELKHTTKDLAEAGKKAFGDFMDGKNEKAVTKWFADVRRDAATIASEPVEIIDHKSIENMAKVEEELEKLQLRTDNYGKSEADLTAEKLRALGASDEQIKRATSLITAYDKLSKKTGEVSAHMAEMSDRWTKAFDMFKDVELPVEKFRNKFDEIGELFEKGEIEMETAFRARSKLLEELLGIEADPTEIFNDTANELHKLLNEGLITDAEFAKAKAKAADVRDSALGADTEQRVQALDIRSAEFQRQRFEPIIKEKIQERQLSEQKRMVELLSRIEGNVKPKQPVAIPAA